MKEININKVMKEAPQIIASLYDNLSNLESMQLEESEYVLKVIDMNNGFAKKGNLSSPRVERIIPNIVSLVNKVMDKGMNIHMFTDSHTTDSKELNVYLEHCLKNTDESELVSELLEIVEENDWVQVIKKNSTNGFLVDETIGVRDGINYIVVGCVTDICVYQYAMTLRKHLDEHNLDGEVIIPIDCVDTFDIDGIHSADFYNLVFINSMISNGIKVVKEIK